MIRILFSQDATLEEATIFSLGFMTSSPKPLWYILYWDPSKCNELEFPDYTKVYHPEWRNSSFWETMVGPQRGLNSRIAVVAMVQSRPGVFFSRRSWLISVSRPASDTKTRNVSSQLVLTRHISCISVVILYHYSSLSNTQREYQCSIFNINMQSKLTILSATRVAYIVRRAHVMFYSDSLWHQ